MYDQAILLKTLDLMTSDHRYDWRLIGHLESRTTCQLHNGPSPSHLLAANISVTEDPMATTTALHRHSQVHGVVYLSPPLPVNMGDWWFDIATLDHFWVRRRFEVMKRLADPVIRNAKHVAEIGCGNGLLQRNMEDYYGVTVVGFDLNELALQKNVSEMSPLYCYNIYQCNPEFHARFDLLLLFDVLEHIEDESGFLKSIRFHLPSAGTLLVNVPAHQSLFSDYDRAAGHVRRYSASQLARVAELNGFKVRALTYWGLPLIPLLLLRKVIRLDHSNGKGGFDPRGVTINAILSLLARCEPIPQRFFGTSVMAVLENH
jgi:SAM-dependent methyltransferase